MGHIGPVKLLKGIRQNHRLGRRAGRVRTTLRTAEEIEKFGRSVGRQGLSETPVMVTSQACEGG